MIKAAPDALRETLAWSAAEDCRLVTARWLLAEAWASQDTDPAGYAAAQANVVRVVRMVAEGDPARKNHAAGVRWLPVLVAAGLEA